MKIKVTTPGKMIVVGGKPSRTPVTIKVKNEQHFKELEILCKSQTLEYHIIDEDIKSDEQIIIEDTLNDSEPVIEELKTGSILDELTK